MGSYSLQTHTPLPPHDAMRSTLPAEASSDCAVVLSFGTMSDVSLRVLRASSGNVGRGAG